MIIEHTIKRPNGSHPKMMDGTVYHFLPNEAGDHVAEVVNLDHIDWFLNVSTFRIYKVQPRVVEAQPADHDPTNPFAHRGVLGRKVSEPLFEPVPAPHISPNTHGMPNPAQKDVQGAVVLRAVSLSKSKFRPKVVRSE